LELPFPMLPSTRQNKERNGKEKDLLFTADGKLTNKNRTNSFLAFNTVILNLA